MTPRLLRERFAIFTLAVALLGATPFWAEAMEPAVIGSSSPAWKNLPGADGKEHSLSDLASAKGVLVIFFANSCPDCELYAERILSLAKANKPKGIATVLVSVSHEPEDDLAAMSAFAKKHSLEGIYVQDKSQRLGKELGAVVTPEAFLFDGDRKLVYRGAIDDHWKAEKVSTRFVQQAVDEMLSGKQVEHPIGEASAGCTIEYED